MLCLLLRLGSDQYAIDVRHVVAVLPIVEMKAVPKAPRSVSGVFNYHGTPVAVLDLSADVLDIPTRHELHSRIIVVNCDDAGDARFVGLLAEHATSTLKCAEEDFGDAGIGGAACFGRVMQHRDGLVQLIDPRALLASTFTGQSSLGTGTSR